MNTTKFNQRRKGSIMEGIWTIDLVPNKIGKDYYYPPNNSAEILIVLNGEIERKSVGSPVSFKLTKNNIYLSNIRSKGTVFIPKGKATLLLIKLNPSTQKLFLKEGLLYARDKISHLKLPIQESFVWKKYIANRDVKKIISSLNKFIVVTKSSNTLKNDKTVTNSIEFIKKNNGKVLVKDIYKKMGVCKSTLEHKFNKEVGISPKEFCKIEKFNHFFSNYKTHEKEMSLTELTYKSGYYDQSHLIKDFRFYVDQNPKMFLSGNNKILL